MRAFLVALALLGCAAPSARAEVVFLASGGSLTVVSLHTEDDRVVLTLRNGGEVTCPVTAILRVEPDDVPSPEPASDAPPPDRGRSPALATRMPVPPLVVDARFDPLITRLAARHGVDAVLVRAIVQVESAYEPRARSGKGAVGLMQVMPATGRVYGIRNLYDPAANLEAGIRHLKSLLDRLPLEWALAAYNAGEATVQRYGGVPPFTETQDYVARVLRLIG
jgi:hypothetical protein